MNKTFFAWSHGARGIVLIMNLCSLSVIRVCTVGDTIGETHIWVGLTRACTQGFGGLCVTDSNHLGSGVQTFRIPKYKEFEEYQEVHMWLEIFPRKSRIYIIRVQPSQPRPPTLNLDPQPKNSRILYRLVWGYLFYLNTLCRAYMPLKACCPR